MRTWLAVFLVVAPVLGACADNIQIAPPVDAGEAADDAAVGADAAPDAPPNVDAPPPRLSDTGLYFDFARKIIDPRNVAYDVQFELWADGATKRRFVRLPHGSTIDTSDMDFWTYPVGTVIFKEFSRGGLLVETRMITKKDAGVWEPVTYLWNAEQNDAVLELGGVTDHLGTGHDVPAQIHCIICHREQPDFVLGFSAIQLDSGAGFGLDDLVADGRLSDPPAGAGPVFFPLPGTAEVAAGLGYLHGNCGGCHHAAGIDQVDVELRLSVSSLAQVTDTPAYQTAVGVTPQQEVGATAIIDPGSPSTSAVHIRMESLAVGTRMPILGSEEIDTAGLAIVDQFINDVPPLN